MNLSLLSPELILAGGALVLLVMDPFVPALRRGGSGAGAMVLTGIAAIALLSLTPSPAPVLSGMISRDSLARGFGLIALLVTLLTVLASRGYVTRLLPALQTEYYALLLFATAGMLLLVSSSHLVMMFVALELMSLSSFALAGIERNKRRSAEGGMKFFLLGALSSALLLYGIAFLYGLTGHLDLFEIGRSLNRAEVPPAAYVALVFVLAGFGFKLSLVPFHMWCPDTYEGSPTPIAGFLSVGSKGAALIALWRVLTVGLAGLAPEWEKMVWLLAAGSMVVGNLVAVQQQNLKRMLAFSTIAHAGYLMVGLIAGSALGNAALFFYIAVYAFMSVGAFAGVAYMSHLGIGEEWGDLAGFSQKHPYVAFAFSLFLLSLAGVPPLAGFAGKFLLFSAAVDKGYYLLAVLGMMTSVVSLYYYVRVMRYMYVAAPPDPATTPLRAPAEPAHADLGLAAVLVAGSLGTVLFGVFPQHLLAFFLDATK